LKNWKLIGVWIGVGISNIGILLIVLFFQYLGYGTSSRPDIAFTDRPQIEKSNELWAIALKMNESLIYQAAIACAFLVLINYLLLNYSYSNPFWKVVIVGLLFLVLCGVNLLSINLDFVEYNLNPL